MLQELDGNIPQTPGTPMLTGDELDDSAIDSDYPATPDFTLSERHDLTLSENRYPRRSRETTKMFHLTMSPETRSARKGTDHATMTSSSPASSFYEQSDPLMCAYCGKYFPSLVSKRRHQRMHVERLAGEGYACGLCAGRFASRTLFYRHYLQEHGAGRQVACNRGDCEATFTGTRQLAEHVLRGHEGDAGESKENDPAPGPGSSVQQFNPETMSSVEMMGDLGVFPMQTCE